MDVRYACSSFFALALLAPPAFCQCGAGEVEVTIEVTTDDFGYETYWELVPGGNGCGNGSIFQGGNPTMDCNSGGLQDQDTSGYENNAVYTEGPWCLVEGELYDIHSIDDWGDGQAAFEVFVDGISAAQFQEEGPLNVFTFAAQGPVARDMGVTGLFTPLYAAVNETVHVRGKVKSFGSDPVTTFDLAYSVDGGPAAISTINSVTLNAGDSYEFEHAIPWLPSAVGAAQLVVSISSINGSNDLNGFNDQLGSQHVISPLIPDLANDYLAAEPLIEVVANSDQDILVPRDLAFHPDASRNEVWVLNKDTEASGGSTVTFYHVDEPNQTFEWRKDINSWHFMSLPTGIAMGDNNCFATCPGVFDANHNGGDPFTGPSLWSADTAIYAQNLFGGLGSHLDMLHVDPNSQGIAHEYWNRYWVVDGYRGDIVMNDFREDHGPGNDYHGNAIIRRYADFSITKDPNDHVVSHAVMDKATGWLYVVDYGGQRVLRMNTNTGSVIGPGNYGPFENYAEYSMMGGYEWEAIITQDLVEPAGIELNGSHLYVSDHSNGDIAIYDITGATVAELGRIHTGQAGLMGLAIGPDGRLWGVNATHHQLLVMDPQEPTGVNAPSPEAARVWPNPANGTLYLEHGDAGRAGTVFELHEPSGRLVLNGATTGRITGIDVSGLPVGAYSLAVRTGSNPHVVRVTIAR